MASAVFAGLSAMSEDHPWAVAAALLAGGSLALYLTKEIVFPYLHRLKLRRNPIRFSYVVTSQDKYDLGYARQDVNQHNTKELVVPAHTDDIYIQLQFKTLTQFTQHHLVFGFDGDPGTYPLIKYFHIGFIKTGVNEKRPGVDNPTHYIDHHDRYHITDVAFRPKGQWVTVGFKVKTNDPGVYKGRLELVIDSEEHTAFLDLHVQTNPSRVVRCIDHEHCFIHPLTPSLPSARPPPAA